MNAAAQTAASAQTPARSGGEHVLEFRDVSKSFRQARRTVGALKNLSFTARAGAVTGLIGPDAAGKTTAMRIAAGLLAPDEGRVHVLGTDVADAPLSVQSAIGYMPQRFGLYDDLTVWENLTLYADLQGVPRGDRPERYEQLLHMTGLGPFTRRLAGKLSGGMKQKLGLACTLVRSPKLLLLDEPTVGVDPVSRRELWEIVYRLVADEGVSVLLSTAYLDEAERCNELVVLHEGKVLGRGTPEQFRRQVEGSVYALRAEGARRRHIQQQLTGREGLLDAVIDGDSVRVVVDDVAPPDIEALLDDAGDVGVEAVEPRFEDSFVAALRRQGRAARRHDAEHNGADAACRARHDGPAIAVENLQRRFGSFYAVKKITFRVNRGEIFGLLGANGAGKSTTFRMLCGLLPASGGSARVAGIDLRQAPARARARIGYMSQKFSLYASLSVGANLRFFSAAYGLSGRRRRRAVDGAAEQFGLSDHLDATSGLLPLGYKQRLAMACAVMHQPDILFLDEPTSGVDPIARREFWSHINAYADRGVTVMVTTHFMAEAEYCDRLAIMAAGKVLTVGTPHDIRSQARSRENPQPSIEDAFVRLAEGGTAEEGQDR